MLFLPHKARLPVTTDNTGDSTRSLCRRAVNLLTSGPIHLHLISSAKHPNTKQKNPNTKTKKKTQMKSNVFISQSIEDMYM